MSKLPTVSIIIPTYNRKSVLIEALLSLNKVDYPNKLFEVIVINDGSSDGTEDAIKSIRKKINYNFKYFDGGRRGISHAKNIAIKKSVGEIIVSTDDDCLFEKTWLKKIIKPFVKSYIGAVGGPDKAIKNENILAKSIDFTFSSFIGSGGIHGRFLKAKLGKCYPPGCNMAFRREIVKKIGKLKQQEKLRVVDHGREKDLINLHHKYSKQGKIDAAFIDKVFDLIVNYSRVVQRKKL